MKTYTAQNVAKVQATKLSTKTGHKHLVVQHGDQWMVGTTQEITAMVAAKTKVKGKAKEAQTVRAKFMVAALDEKYLTVVVDDHKFRLANSRVTCEGEVIIGQMADVTMTAKYAASRPELKVAA